MAWGTAPVVSLTTFCLTNRNKHALKVKHTLMSQNELEIRNQQWDVLLLRVCPCWDLFLSFACAYVLKRYS